MYLERNFRVVGYRFGSDEADFEIPVAEIDVTITETLAERAKDMFSRGSELVVYRDHVSMA